jgi:YD repeat-containing protein
MLGRFKFGRSAAKTFAVTLSAAVLLGVLPRAAATAARPATTSNPFKSTPSCSSCDASAAAARLEGPAALGRGTQNSTLLPVQRSIREGARINLVGTSNGELAFAVNDLELRGPMPVFFQRVYASGSAEDRGLGAGWSFVFDDRINVEGDAAVLRTGSGATLLFRRVARGSHFELKSPEPGLHQSFNLAGDDTAHETAAGFERTYAKVGDAYRLSRIADAYGNAVTIGFDARGRVARIAGVGGAALTLKWASGRDARLLSVADSAGRRVSFRHEAGRLRAFTDAAGALWSYNYVRGRLSRATDPLGRVILRASYDARGRALETGDAAGSYSFRYDAARPGELSRQTLVTDPVGARLVFRHTEAGALSSIEDGEGRLFAAEYNAAGRPAQVTDHTGQVTTFDYDAQNGSLKSYASDRDGRAASQDDSARVAKAVRDARGRLTSLVSKQGLALSFEYDARGNETAVTYSDSARFEASYDRAGLRVFERLPSGLSSSYAYDARGQVVGRRDARGRFLKIERDASGAVERVSGDGRWVRAERDAAGRVVALFNSEGQRRRFAYDARGALKEFIDARGERSTFAYDRRGRLRSVTDAAGATWSFVYDAAGRLASVTRGGDAPGDASARFVKTGFSPPAPQPPQTGFGCLAGDGWFAGDAWEELYGAGCWDLLGDFGSGGGPYSGYNPEACWQCKIRHKSICEKEWNASFMKAIGYDLVGTVACAGITAGTLSLACAAAAGVLGYTQYLAANEDYEACMLKSVDQCATYCNVS